MKKMIITFLSIFILFLCQTALSSSLFYDMLSFSAGDGPFSVATGDLDGDGNLDLAVANYYSDNVSVLLGNGDGTFQTAANYGAGDGPVSVATGDLDGDGNLDLAVANSNSDNVSVLLGNGDGTFQTAANYGAGEVPFSVATGDMDGDGNLDLAMANYYSDNVSVLINNKASVTSVTIEIDIKPGSYPNSINLGSNGNVPVAILTSETFDATEVDPYSVTLEGAEVVLKLKGKAETLMASYEDVNEDGFDDLIVHVDTEGLELSEEDTIADLKGETYGGTSIIGKDMIRIVPVP